MAPEEKTTVLDPKERIIVALDVSDASAAREIIAELSSEVGAFKIGLQLFSAAGPSFVEETVRAGHKIFLDLKFHDIPNTVARASVEVARLGVWMFNVHALGGSEMMRRAFGAVREVCARENLCRPKMIGVTVLTSSSRRTLKEIGIDREVEVEVLNLSHLTAECGLDGVVASPLETVLIRRQIAGDFIVVTPGIRVKPDDRDASFATSDDQRRVMTPGAAVANGSDYLVIGRPITEAFDRRSAVKKILGEFSRFI